MPDVADIVVVGGGCTGTSIAWQLARRRAGRIVLLEQHGLATGATGKSSAIVRTHYPHEALARMALRAREIFEQFEEVVGGAAAFRRTGFLVLVGPADRDALAANVAMHRRIGIDARVCSPDVLHEIEPRLTLADVAAGAWEPDSGYADPHGTTLGYAAAARQHGADVRLGVRVERLVCGPRGIEGVATSEGTVRTPAVIVAAGYRSRDLIAPLGVALPLTPVRHTMAIVERTPMFGPAHPVISDRVLGGYYRPEGTALTLVGAGAPSEGHVDGDVEVDRSPELADLETLTGRFWQRFPTEAQAGLRGGFTGVYDCAPDFQPLLGAIAGVRGLHIAAGFSGHGFKLSPVVGELLAQHVLGERTSPVDIALFSPDRFAAQRPITVPRPYSGPP